MEKISVRVPMNGWLPRPHQKKLWQFLQEAASAQSRSGTDAPAKMKSVCITTSVRDLDARKLLALPAGIQTGPQGDLGQLNPHTGKRRIDEAFPHEMRESTNDKSCASVSTTDQPGKSLAVTPSRQGRHRIDQLPELYSQNLRWQTRQRGPTTGRSSRKTTAGPRSSLLPEDAIIFAIHQHACQRTPDGSPNSLPQKTLALSHTKLLPKP